MWHLVTRSVVALAVLGMVGCEDPELFFNLTGFIIIITALIIPYFKKEKNDKGYQSL